MAQFSKTDQRRITFLSLLSTAATIAAGEGVGTTEAYEDATNLLDQMEADGFFGGESSPSSQGPSGRSARPASRSQSGSRGRDRQSGGFNGQMRDPQGPPTKAQIGKLLSLTEDYTWEDAEAMTKLEVSQLIDDLVG